VCLAAGGIQEHLDLGDKPTADGIFEKLTGVAPASEITAGLQRRRQDAAAYDARKLTQLAAERDSADAAGNPEEARA
jgi:hypothetical protein